MVTDRGGAREGDLGNLWVTDHQITHATWTGDVVYYASRYSSCGTASMMMRNDGGVGEAGFITTVHPANSAGASLTTIRLIGKFQGAISAQTPIGSLRTS